MAEQCTKYVEELLGIVSKNSREFCYHGLLSKMMFRKDQELERLFNSLKALVIPLPKLYYNIFRSTIDVAHQGNLGPLFNLILLVDTDSVNPEEGRILSPLFVGREKIKQIFYDWE
jgi:hypothetical protein